VEVEDHPLDYGDFEGTIPQGEYGGGTVMLWDRGFWAPENSDPQRALRKGELKFTLAGEKLQGSWVIVRMRHDRERSNRNNWLLIKHRDGCENGVPITDQDRSVASGRTMAEIAAGKGRRPKPFMLSSDPNTLSINGSGGGCGRRDCRPDFSKELAVLRGADGPLERFFLRK
jgi:bifunctional non-homologous end joining protein LigD